MRASLILATYNRLSVLKRCLDALNGQEGVQLSDVEVLVVDDASSDGSYEFLQNSTDKYRFTLRPFQQNHAGQGNARNLALNEAQGEIVFLIGDDSFFKKNTLAEHLKVHDLYPEKEYAVLGFTTWHPDLHITPFMYFLEHGGHQFAFSKIRKQFPNSKSQFQKEQTKDNAVIQPPTANSHPLFQANYWFFYTINISLKRALIEDSPQSTDDKIAAVASLPRNDKKKPTRFEPVYTSYGWEDIDFGYRLEKEKGMKILYNPAAISYHYHEVTMDGFAERMQSIAKNALVFHKRFPEVPVLPTGVKKIIFQILSWKLSISVLQALSKKSARFEQLYFYALMKRYWMEGIV